MLKSMGEVRSSVEATVSPVEAKKLTRLLIRPSLGPSGIE